MILFLRVYKLKISNTGPICSILLASKKYSQVGLLEKNEFYKILWVHPFVLYRTAPVLKK